MNRNHFGLREMVFQKEALDKSIESYLNIHFYQWFIEQYPTLKICEVYDTYEDYTSYIIIRFDYDMEMPLNETVDWLFGDYKCCVKVSAKKTLLVKFVYPGVSIPKDLYAFLAKNPTTLTWINDNFS